MTENEIINLFFRKKEKYEYSNTYLTNAYKYLPEYSKMIKKRPEEFIKLMENINDEIYSLYENYIYNDIDLYKLIKKINRNKKNNKKYDFTSEFKKYLEKEKINSYDIKYINEESFLVTMPRKSSLFKKEEDLMIIFKTELFEIIELKNEEKTINKGKNYLFYDNNIKELKILLSNFKEKNKIKFLLK